LEEAMDGTFDYVLVVMMIIMIMMMTQLEEFAWSPYSNFSWKKTNLNVGISK
jgi:hypothetical protein